MSKISVIVPVYNVGNYLQRCIDSILNQKYRDFQLIIVDDGSLDNGSFICDEYLLKDERIVVIHQDNRGLSAARNTGIDWVMSNSNSKWITFIDSDDWVHSMYLQAMVDALEHTGLEIAMVRYQITDKENPMVDISKLECDKWNSKNLYRQHHTNAIIACGKLYNKNLFKDTRYPVGYIHEDLFVTYKLLFKCAEVAVINEPLYAYFNNPNGITKSKWNPSKLNVTEAFDEKAQFFLMLGDRELYENAVSRLFDWIYGNWKYIVEQNIPEKEKYIKALRKLYIRYYKKYRQDFPKKRKELFYKYLLVSCPIVVSTYEKLKPKKNNCA